MIFKILNSDSDKFIAKLGVFNRSFEQFGKAIRSRQLEIADLMGAMGKHDAQQQAYSIWDRLGYTKKSYNENSIDLSFFDNFDANSTLKSLQKVQIQVYDNETTWQEYFSNLDSGSQWQEKFIKDNDLFDVSLEQVENAQKAAREAAIEHNKSLKELTFSAQAGKIATSALAAAGNMFVGWAVSKGIELAVTAIDNYIHRVDRANEAMDSAVGAYESAKSGLENISSALDENNARIDELLSKGKLTYTEEGELERLQEITKELLLQKKLRKEKQPELPKRPLTRLLMPMTNSMVIMISPKITYRQN